MKSVEEIFYRALTIQFTALEGNASLVTLAFINAAEMKEAAEGFAAQLPEDMDAVFHETDKPNRMRITLIDPATGDVFKSRDEIVYFPPLYNIFKEEQHSEVYLTVGYWTENNMIEWIEPKLSYPILLNTIQYA